MPTWTQLLEPFLKPTGLTGGAATDLDGIVTAGASGLPVGARAMVIDGTDVYFYHLRAGTDAESSPAIIRPDDYNGTTNQKVWEKLTVV